LNTAINRAPDSSVWGVSREDHVGRTLRSSRHIVSLVSEATGFAQPVSSTPAISSIISQSSVHARSGLVRAFMVNLLGFASGVSAAR
jgi:hypothetical protein